MLQKPYDPISIMLYPIGSVCPNSSLSSIFNQSSNPGIQPNNILMFSLLLLQVNEQITMMENGKKNNPLYILSVRTTFQGSEHIRKELKILPFSSTVVTRCSHSVKQ